MTKDSRYTAGTILFAGGAVAALFAQMSGFPENFSDPVTIGGVGFAVLGFALMRQTGVREHLRWLRRKSGLKGRRE